MKLLTLTILFVALGFSQSNDCDSLAKCKKALKTSRNSSLAHYRIAELYFLQANYIDAINQFRESLAGDLDPKWTEVCAHINMGKIYDATNQRARAVNEYRLALRTKDDTRGALSEANKYIEAPYSPAAKEASPVK